MRVKSIILDGFKSYAHRKLLDDLSPHFNAITGLNGSGKSNIFDAICFVMGITNLKRVRAEDPRELIYHGGSRGVHTARVTIEFWNDDPKTAPPGYNCEDYPIITVGRQISNKGKQQFFLNNAVSMQSKVKRFFESISLNVDNPHFMVLQGTVHKLIGMRSSDILALIEEAVGTKTFDHRRRTAENLIRGKERKMKEIEENITTQIGPMLQVMKADQEEYNRFIHLNATLDERRRFRVAYEYFQRTEAMATKEAHRLRLSEDLALVKSQAAAIPSQESDASAKEKQLQESMLAPAESAAALHEEEGELKRVLARYKTQLESADKALKAGEVQLKKLHKDQAAHARQVEQLAKLKSKRVALLESIHSEKEDVANLKKALQLHDSGVRAGLSGVSLEEELHRIDGSLIALDAEIRRRSERHSELEAELKRVKARNDHDAVKHAQLKKEMDAAVSRHREMEAKYADIAPLELKAQQLQQELMASREEHHKLNDAYLREMSSGGGNFDVQFAHPSSSSGSGGRRGFQAHAAQGVEEEKELRKHILGRVGELVRPNEERYGIALTVGAQAQLMRVVTTDDTIVERIIARGLRQRTSFLPLNRLSAPRTIDRSRLEQARRIAASHSSKAKGAGGVKSEPFVAVARDLVEVDDPRCAAVADVVFGGFLVCSDLMLAQALAYDPQVKCKAVTLDGEVADPNGLMSGGSMQSLRDMFAAMRAHRDRKAPLRRLSEQIQEQEAAYEGLRVKLGQHAATIKAFRDSEEAVEMATHRFQLVQGSSKSELEELAAAMEAEQTARTEAVGRRDELRKRKEEIAAQKSQDPTNMRKEIQGRLREAQQRLKGLQDEEDAGVAAFEKLEAETEQRASDLETQCKECEEEIALRTDERSKVVAQLERTQEELRDVESRCRQAEEQRQGYEKDLEEVREEQQRLAEQRANLEGTLKNHESDIKELHKNVEAMKKAIAHDERTHMWLESQRDHFGDVDGPFFFRDAARTEKALQELREAEAHAAVMGRKMNKKASILYDERKKEYDDLVEQLKNLGEDRGAIQQCIQGIEAKKWSALDRMVRVISAIFSKLFSTCLPGAAVQLREERDSDTQHLVGLNVKVTFNGKEKESLSELSGGQRSLLALCLILAILRVRQAPVYILDEVDAALDPSHTQNIGRMLQTHFPGSQFLLVSLKDGMYNNADVLYQIRNTQGFSEVTRIAAKRQQQPQ